MNLVITTPLSVVVREDNVVSLRAEDPTGSFGVQPGHAEFLTVLTISVVSWRRADGSESYCAVRRGAMTVSGGSHIEIATREAVPSDDPETLEADVLARFHADLEAERTEHTESTRLQLAAIRQIMQHLRPDGQTGGRA